MQSDKPTIMATLSRFNPFPLPIWLLFFIMFAAGYFTGGAVMSTAIRENDKKTWEYFRSRGVK